MVRYYNQNNNININNDSNDNKNGLDIYKEEQEQIKTYRYCWKCLRDFSEPSVMPFCDFACYQEYCQEERKELDACFGEFLGRD